MCAVILGTNYRGYENALKVLEISKLSERREVLCLNFAKKAIKNDKYQHWFVVNEQNQLGMQTRSDKTLCNRLGSRGGGRVKYLNINRFD